MREILGLRAAGVDVDTVSVHQADGASLLAEADRREAERRGTSSRFRRTLFRERTRAPFWPTRLPISGSSVKRCGPPRAGSAAIYGSCFISPKPSPYGTMPSAWGFAICMPTWPTWPPISVGGPRSSAIPRRSQNWRWSFTMHGPTELFAVDRFNLARKVAHADLVVCISDFTRSQLMYLSEPDHWAKMHVVHCGADLSRYPLEPPRQGPGFVVLSVARLAAQKGLEVLFSAVKLIADSGTDVQLVLVGDGPMRARLHRRAERLGITDRVALAGAVGQDEMADYYAGADVFCLPSFAEGVPVVLMEAMASGRPVVATRIAGVPELVEDGVSGLLVAPGNADELALALERLASSPRDRERMGPAGRRKVVEDFDSEKCAAQLARVFQEMPSTGSIARPASLPTTQ